MSTDSIGELAPNSVCQRCGGHVTAQYARVFGDNDDIVHGCQECKTGREMYEGGGV